MYRRYTINYYGRNTMFGITNKSQFPSTKSQINSKHQISIFKIVLNILIFKFDIYLEFGF